MRWFGPQSRPDAHGRSYRGRHRLLCPHRLGWNRKKQSRVLCYQYGGESERTGAAGPLANWRCMAVDELSQVKLLEGFGAPLNHLRPQTCVGEVDVDVEDDPSTIHKRGSEGVPEQVACNRDADRGDGVRIMAFGANAIPAAGSPAAAGGLIIQDFRRGLRGKNGSARLPGTHKLQCRVWRDDENRASLGLHSGPSPSSCFSSS